MPSTPYLLLDIDVALTRYQDLAAALPGTALHYAVKANPHPALLRALAEVGSSFDIASPGELRACLDAGAPPERLVYSNPVKRREDIAVAHDLGVRLFVTDSIPETAKIAAAAPGAQVLCRLSTSGAGADYGLSRKFGAPADDAAAILRYAAEAGLDPAGVSFHVGSQQRDPDAWRPPLTDAAVVFEKLRADGHSPWLLDLGGGFPGHHLGATPGLPTYGAAIESALRDTFGSERPQTLVEPGRGLVADAGTLVTTVIGIAERYGQRWVFLDAGVFTGLVETLDEAIRYRIATSRDGGPVGPCVLAGPTCDSADVLYEKRPVELPVELAEGDEVRFLSAGAYTSAYSTVGFNGFAPLAVEIA
jgi:ornithine decarboxylase